jgi:hypothetical protein
MYSQYERHGDALLCSSCGEQVIKSGVSIGPVFNPDGTPYHGNSARSLWVRCSRGHETPVSLGSLGRLHYQVNPPTLNIPGIIAR